MVTGRNESWNDMCKCDHHRDLHRTVDGHCGGRSRYHYPNDCECRSFELTDIPTHGFGWNPCA
jgi:hypothetical protein